MAYKTSKETQERKDQKKEHIIRTAVNVFCQNGYHGTTVKNIVDVAEVSVGTFYFYFKSKEDLFETMYDELSTVLYGALCVSLNNLTIEIDKGFSKAIAFFFRAIESHESMARIMLIEAVGLNSKFEAKRAEVTRKYVDYAAFHFDKLKSDGILSTPDVRIAATAFIGTLYTIVMEWLQSNSNEKLTNYVYALSIFNLQALGIDFNDEKIKEGIEEALNDEMPFQI
ncbi:MAG: TetR/AcrR family transcriptional regulator [Vallitaleaceae bacterium]|nr:TetR/AcrR family transcriptional regulator [Vallitaleaceae bacterium]